ncbi:epimerase, partial [Dolichospermum sp. ST_sed4]|nr:epimerase [Dolichospermum sp. ST_sed4]
MIASAVGVYGDKSDFLPNTCRDWEDVGRKELDQKVKVMNLRFGIILSRNGEALKKMAFPFQLGLGAVLGSGKQNINWIHIEDAVRAILYLLQ